jgi:predicted Zn-dependent protease
MPPQNSEINNSVYLYGFGEYDTDDLKTIQRGINDFDGYKVYISNPISHISTNFYSDMGGLNANKILNNIELGDEGFRMMITNSPLYLNQTEVKTISGCAVFFRRYSIVSTYQLKQNGNYRTSNLNNVAKHEIGHNLGLRHCEGSSCLMNELGTSNVYMCEQCKERLRK